MSQGIFGPTEIRLLLIAGNVALMRSPFATIAGHRWLLFDVGGVIAAVGMFAMANLTYVGPAAPISQAWDVLLKTGGLQKRELPASPVLSQMRDHIVNLWKSWNDSEARQIAAMNLFLDAPIAQRRASE